MNSLPHSSPFRQNFYTFLDTHTHIFTNTNKFLGTFLSNFPRVNIDLGSSRAPCMYIGRVVIVSASVDAGGVTLSTIVPARHSRKAGRRARESALVRCFITTSGVFAYIDRR